MKKLFRKQGNKKTRRILCGTVITTLLIADFLCSKSFQESKGSEKELEIEVAESAEPSPISPSFETYEELKKEYEEDNAEDRDTEEKINENKETESTYETSDAPEDGKEETSDSSVGGKQKVIDESDETMRDETAGTEKEYDPEKEPQGKVILETPGQKVGKDVEDTTNPGGKQGVGTWS